MRVERPELVVVAMSCSDEMESPALSRGADAFVAKSEQTDALIETVVRLGRRLPLAAADASSGPDTAWVI